MTEKKRTRARDLGVFLYVWLMLGFTTGTLLLVGPVRWITAYFRSAGRESGENAAMVGVIVSFVIVSALLAWFAVKQMGRVRSRAAAFSVPAVLTCAAIACLYLWSNPALMAGAAGGVGGSVTVGGDAEFVFGPYPDRARLEALKAENYTAVVSLQHPAVLPFEPPGIAAEQQAASEIGLTFIHAPMLPWISANDESLERIRALAREGRGRYYVHCGLGRDRANVVKRMLEREGASVAAGAGYREARTFGLRHAEGNKPMERGRLMPLEDDVFLIPYPNKHEMFGNMLSGQVAHVLVLLDPADPVQQPWIAEARQRFTEFHVPHSFEPLAAGDAARAKGLVETARRLPRPLVVIVPFMAPHADSAVADTWLQAWDER